MEVSLGLATSDEMAAIVQERLARRGARPEDLGTASQRARMPPALPLPPRDRGRAPGTGRAIPDHRLAGQAPVRLNLSRG